MSKRRDTKGWTPERRAEAAVGVDSRLGALLGRLQEVHARKFEGLPGVIRALADPDVPSDAPDP